MNNFLKENISKLRNSLEKYLCADIMKKSSIGGLAFSF